jgi:hypothetical protein
MMTTAQEVPPGTLYVLCGRQYTDFVLPGIREPEVQATLKVTSVPAPIRDFLPHFGANRQQQQQQILFLVPQGDRLPNRPNLVYPTPIPKTLYIMYHGPNWQSNGRMVLTTGRLYNTKAWPPLSPEKGATIPIPGQYTAQQTGLYNSYRS